MKTKENQGKPRKTKKNQEKPRKTKENQGKPRKRKKNIRKGETNEGGKAANLDEPVISTMGGTGDHT